MAQLEPGDKAPDFTLRDQEGRTVKLAHFRGRKLLLYFYPKADTPGCTKQSCSVRDAKDSLAARDTAVVGISPDTPEKQQKFDKKHGLRFPLLSDPDHAVAEAYGVWGLKKFMGREYMGVLRTTFIIGPDGKVERMFEKVKPAGHSQEVLEAVKSL